MEIGDATATSMNMPTYPERLEERYEPVRELGRGAYGVVYLAMDLQLRREVAVKLMLPEKLDREEPLERFLREARLMSRIKSRYVAEVYDFGEEGGRPYLVSRYVNGKSLKDLLRKHPEGLPFAEASRLVDQILQGLEACHQAGIIHRDLKPANLLMTREGDVAVTDFGLGRADQDQTLTASGTVVGTPAYMAPEQMQGLLTNVALDLYAVGLIYCEFLTGKVPMLESSLSETFLKRLAGPAPGWLDRAPPETPPELEELLRRTLDPDPSRRPSSARTLLESIRFLVGDSRALPSLPREITSQPPKVGSDRYSVPKDLPSEARDPSGKKTWPRLLGFFLLVVLVAFGFSSGKSSPPGAGRRASARSGAGEGSGQAAESWETFRTLVAKMHADPAIARCLELTEDVAPIEARKTWIAARESFRESVRSLTERVALDALGAEGAGAPEVEAVTRVTLLERLLSRSARASPGPLYQGMQPPGFALLKDRLYQTRTMRAFTSDLMEREKWRSQSLFRLNEMPQRWKCLRRMEDQIVPWKGRMRMDTGLRLRLPSGEVYQNPTKEVPDGAVLFIRPDMDRSWTLRAPAEIRIDLEAEAPGSDLVFFVTADSWTLFNHLLVRVKGRDKTLRLMESFPPCPPSEGSRKAYQAILFRIPAALVPEGLRQLEFSAVGIQSIGNPEYIVYLLEAYVLLDGPQPEVFQEALLEGALPDELP